MTPRNKNARAQGYHKGSKAGGGGGAAHGECGCSSLRVPGWWMFTINSPGDKISIAGCVEEIVRDPNPMPFFFLSFFYIRCFVLINYWEQRLRAALAIVKKEPHPRFLSNPAPGKKPTTQVTLVRGQPHASHAK